MNQKKEEEETKKIEEKTEDNERKKRSTHTQMAHLHAKHENVLGSIRYCYHSPSIHSNVCFLFYRFTFLCSQFNSLFFFFSVYGDWLIVWRLILIFFFFCLLSIFLSLEREFGVFVVHLRFFLFFCFFVRIQS